jgi:urease accessory protein
MYANTYLSEPIERLVPERHQRVKGKAAISYKYNGSKTCLDKLYQHGSAKIRLPKKYDEFSEAVLINTAGGLTGGDQLDWNVKLDANTKAVLTTQACEKSYKASSGTAQVSTHISVGNEAICHWLPQETILYEGSSLSRTLNIELEANSRLIAMEAVMLGREAMGENVKACYFKDRWRIVRDGRILFADDVKLEGDIEKLASQNALMAGHKAFATLVYCGPEDDDHLNLIATELQTIIKNTAMALSAFEGKIVARFLSCDTYQLRASLSPILKKLSGNDLPRVWRI